MAAWLTRDVVVDGRRIAARERGSAEPTTLVFVHGLGMHQRSWDRVTKTLDGFRLVTFDHAGHGRSEPADMYSVAGLLDDVRAVIAQLDVGDRYVIVGHSMGADVSLLHASSSEGCRGAVLVDGALTASSPAADWDDLSLVQDRFVFKVASTLGRWLGIAPSLSVHEIRSLTEDLEKARAGFDAALAKLPLPVLYVIGEQADRVPDGEAIHERKMSSVSAIATRNNVQVAYLPCGHLVPLREPARLGELISRFATSLLA